MYFNQFSKFYLCFTYYVFLFCTLFPVVLCLNLFLFLHLTMVLNVPKKWIIKKKYCDKTQVCWFLRYLTLLNIKKKQEFHTWSLGLDLRTDTICNHYVWYKSKNFGDRPTFLINCILTIAKIIPTSKYKTNS